MTIQPKNICEFHIEKVLLFKYLQNSYIHNILFYQNTFFLEVIIAIVKRVKRPYEKKTFKKSKNMMSSFIQDEMLNAFWREVAKNCDFTFEWSFHRNCSWSFPPSLIIFLALIPTFTHSFTLTHTYTPYITYTHTHALTRTYKYTHFWYFYHFSSHSIQKWCTWNERDSKNVFQREKKE